MTSVAIVGVGGRPPGAPTTLDLGFFGLSTQEAAAMDPRLRTLLPVSWEAVEDAGLDPFALAGTDTGCFGTAATGLSHQLDLRGPSLAVDTAGSPSLVAVHLAVRSLLDGECAVALAVDGDAAVVLKRLADADGDSVHAVIRGSAVNHDGRGPSGAAREAVLRAAHRRAGTEPSDADPVAASGVAGLVRAISSGSVPSGVGSFGGVNAHLVLVAPEAAPSPARVVPERAMLLPVSARTDTALMALAARYRALLADPTVPVAALCHSAGRRAQHGLRVGVVGADRAALRAALSEVDGIRSTPGPLRFAFGEQGRVDGRAARLFLQEPVFRAAVTACEDVAGWSLTDVLIGDTAVPPELAGPVRVAVHIGLVDLVAHWGIRPDTATGAGVGTLSAAYATGMLDRATVMTAAVRGEPGPDLPSVPAVTTVDCQAGVPDAILMLGEGADDRAGLLGVAARLYEAGYDLDWAAVCGTGARVRPPAYPWESQDARTDEEIVDALLADLLLETDRPGKD